MVVRPSPCGKCNEKGVLTVLSFHHQLPVFHSHLEQVSATFRPLFKALALFPYGASVELWRLSGLLKPIVTRLGIKRKVCCCCLSAFTIF